MNAQNLPTELMSHILSFRPRHPLAQIIKDHKDNIEMIDEWEMTRDDEGDDYTLFYLKQWATEEDGFKQMLHCAFDERVDRDEYCIRVQRDYHFMMEYSKDMMDYYIDTEPILNKYVPDTEPNPSVAERRSVAR